MKSIKEITLHYMLYNKSQPISDEKRNSLVKKLLDELTNNGFEISEDYTWGRLSAKIIGRYENEIGFYYKGEISDNQVTVWKRDSKLEKFLRYYNPNLKGGTKS